MKNSSGIPCNETHYTPKAERNRIGYEFVTRDGNTPSSCTVAIGDTDPLTGEKLTDLEFMHLYYRQVDREINAMRKGARLAYSGEQKAWRKREAQTWSEDFRKKYGYSPSPDDIRFHLEELEKNPYNVYYDGLENAEGESLTDYMPCFGRMDPDPFGTDLPDEVYALREYAGTLAGRRRAVYEAMLTKAAGGKARSTNAELAKEWGVSQTQIRKDQEQIIKGIRRAIENSLRNE